MYFDTLATASERLKLVSNTPSVAVIGQSHTHALQRGMTPDTRFNIIDTNTLKPSWLDKSSAPTPEFLGNYDPSSYCVSMLGGNFHTVFGLVEHNVRWDFYCGYSTVKTADVTRQIIPFNLMHEFFYNSLNKAVLIPMTHLRNFFKSKMVHICSPPHFYDSDHIHKYPYYFKDKLANGVTPAPIRKKLFDLHSRIIQDHCDKIGVTFLPPPPESVDEEGHLLKPYWANDSAHAGNAYGGVLQKQLVEALSL